MIGERYAVGMRAAVVARGSRSTPLARRRITIPAGIGREMFGSLARQSMLARLMLAMGFFAIALLIYLAQASQVSVHEFAIADLRRDQMTLMIQSANLTATSTQLQSLTRVTAIATNGMHMTRPDVSSTMWVDPLLPAVQTPPSPAQTVAAAKHRSQPLAWMNRAITFIKSQL